MTREEIIAKWDGMTPRERDAWVAEVVFGINIYPRVGYRSIDGEVYNNETGELLPRYTEDIIAAWAVFTHFPYIEIARIPGEFTVYGARINDNDGMVLAMTQKPTAPEAIGLAAILAKLLTKEVAP